MRWIIKILRSEFLFRFAQIQILKLVNSKSKMCILDLGCGNGNFIRPLIKKHKVIGVDISEDVIKLARQKGINCFRANVYHLPFSDEIFDYVFCIGLLQYLNNLPGVFDEIKRVLKKNGRLIIHTLNSKSPVRKILKYLDPDCRSLKMFSTHQILKLYNKTGFETEKIIYDYHPLPLMIPQKTSGWLFDLSAFSFVVVAEKLS